MVSSALNGQLQQQTAEDWSPQRRGKRDRKECSMDTAFRSAFMGLGFMFVAIALSFSGIGRGWWFWMLIPAFSMMGTGIAQYMRMKEQQKRTSLPPVNFPQSRIQPPPARVSSFPQRNTGELRDTPPSVTEGTTRHLGAEAPTRHLDE
jgi:hypothetical protein